MKNWFKTRIAKVGNWLTDATPMYVSNAELCIGGFLQGSGAAAWWFIGIFAIYGLLTGKKLDFVKK